MQKRLVNTRARYVCSRAQPRAVIQSTAEADWIIVDVALRDVDEGVRTLATELQRDGRALVKRALHNQPAELSLLLCSDDEILKLNKNWRGKGKADGCAFIFRKMTKVVCAICECLELLG